MFDHGRRTNDCACTTNAQVEETQTLADAKARIAELSVREAKLKRQVQKARAALDEQESHLRDNLLRRQRDLEARIASVPGPDLEYVYPARLPLCALSILPRKRPQVEMRPQCSLYSACSYFSFCS